MNNTNKEEHNTPIHYDSITDMAGKYIIKYVDRRFSPMYWISGGRRGHGRIDYDEMPKVILHIMKEQLFIVIPLILEDENAYKNYKQMKAKLNELPEKINEDYIDTHKINLDEMREDVLLTLFHTFKPTSNREVA